MKTLATWRWLTVVTQVQSNFVAGMNIRLSRHKKCAFLVLFAPPASPPPRLLTSTGPCAVAHGLPCLMEEVLLERSVVLLSQVLMNILSTYALQGIREMLIGLGIQEARSSVGRALKTVMRH